MIRNYADHAANERTFLAWVRTTIAVVGFGIAGARLGVDTPSTNPALAGWSDAVVLGVGSLVMILAYVRMRMIRARIDSDTQEEDDSTTADVMLAVVVVAFFALLAAFVLRLSV